MTDVTASIEVDRPVDVVYNQWTQFEEFPRFMEAVEEVRQIDDATLFWRAQISGVERSWEARIVEQEPDRAIAWASLGGVSNAGRVTFEPLGPAKTRVDLAINVEPDGIIESMGEALGVIERRAKGDLDRFRAFIESRPHETGAWRGEIRQGEVETADSHSKADVPANAEMGEGTGYDEGEYGPG